MSADVVSADEAREMGPHVAAAEAMRLRATVVALHEILDGRTTPPTDEEIRAHALSGGSWLIAWDDAEDAGYGTPEGGVVEGFDAPREWRDRGDVVVFDWRPLNALRRPCAWPEANPVPVSKHA